jgi:CRISP-associated protein Cas1
VLIQNKCRLNLKNRQLRLENELGEQTLALEDIGVVVLETHQATLTSALLAQLSERGICLLTCDESHVPNGALMPFNPHHRQLQQTQLQLDWTEPFKKRCWQVIIRQKIDNQKLNLQQAGEADMADRLAVLGQSVQSGDTDNREAVAAKLYWPAYFGKSFKRQSDQWHSSALNYAYAVVRSCLAKHLTAAGLIPALGLHHRSQLNPWNLADDLLEPFRPLVDRYVRRLAEETVPDDSGELSVLDRQKLVGILTHQCRFDGQSVTMLLATELMVQSLISASKQKEAKFLKKVE